jgi:hypothetical protein
MHKIGGVSVLRSVVSPFPIASGADHLMQAVKGISMEKWLCWISMGVAGVLLLLFLLDFFTGIPFSKISKFVDVVAVLASGIVLYLAWDAYRDLR